MKLGIYSIKDTKIGYMKPFYTHNDAVALRDFENAVNDKQVNIVNQNKDDMELWRLGDFNDETGEIKNYTAYLAKANDFISGIMREKESNNDR